MIKNHNLSYGNSGWFLSVSEKPTSSWLMEKAIAASCMCWWGQYRNLPFCWINPWGWTWKVGTEERNLGSAWMAVGQWLHRFEDRGWRELVRIPLTRKQAMAIDAGFVESLDFLEGPKECPYDYHEMSDEDRGHIACLCQPHSVGGAYCCPEGCPTHNPGGPDVPDYAVGGPATDECEGHEDCPRCDVTDPCPCCGVKAVPAQWERLMTIDEIRAELGLPVED